MNPALSRALYYAGQAYRGEPVVRVQRELDASQDWSRDRLLDQQWLRMRRLAAFAYETVPYYRERWSGIGITPSDLRDRSDWQRLPALTKQDLQEQTAALTSARARAGHIATTSGSSGTPVAVRRSHESWAHAHANVFRGWHWHGLEVGDRYAYFWGLALDARGRRQAWLRDWFFNRRRLSAFDTSDSTARRFYDTLMRWRPAFGFGYPSAATQFADAVTRLGLDGRRIGLKAIITTAEVLHPHRRDRLASTFGCAVVDSYGAAEIGVAGFACPQGGMHVPIESVVVDLEPIGDDLYEVLITDLFNFSQPVIRYRIGDVVAAPPEPCPCGRALPLLGAIQGRSGDSIRLADGRVINGLLPYYIFRHHAKSGKVLEYQFAHYPDGALELRVVPGAGWTDAVARAIEQEVSAGLETPVRLAVVSRFERRGRGKHRDYLLVDVHGRPLSDGSGDTRKDDP